MRASQHHEYKIYKLQYIFNGNDWILKSHNVANKLRSLRASQHHEYKIYKLQYIFNGNDWIQCNCTMLLLCKVSTQHRDTKHNCCSQQTIATQPTLHQKPWRQRQVLSSRNSKDPNEYLRSTNQCFTLCRPGLCKVDLLWMHSFSNI